MNPFFFLRINPARWGTMPPNHSLFLGHSFLIHTNSGLGLGMRLEEQSQRMGGAWTGLG